MATLIYGFTSLDIADGNSLKEIDGAILNDGDMALGIHYISVSPDVTKNCFYVLDADSGAAESLPDIVAPTSNAGNKRWLLKGILASDTTIAGELTIDTVGAGTTGETLVLSAEGVVQKRSDTEIDLTPAEDAYSNGSVIVKAIAVENVVVGSLCYMNSSGQMELSNAEMSEKMPALYLATTITSAGNEGTFLKSGVIHLHTLNPAWTVGGAVYAGSGATEEHGYGAMSQGIPIGGGNQVQIVGMAIGADILDFNPENMVIELL